MPEKNRNQLTRSSRRKWRCICPRCGREHRLMVRYTGRGVPRFFCAQCSPIAKRRSTEEDTYTIQPGAARRAVAVQ